MSDLSLEHQVALLPKDEQEAVLDGLDLENLPWDWKWSGRPSQILPVLPEEGGDDWDLALALAGRGFGKHVTLDTMLPHTLPLSTSTGFTKMGDVNIGDIVYDEQGKPCNVVAIYDNTPDKAYRVTFSDGTFIDACDEHLWVTWTHRDRKQYLRNNPGVSDFPDDWVSHREPLYRASSKGGKVATGASVGPEVRTTQQIRDTLAQNTARKDLNHCIPVARPLQTPDVPLLLDPWLLGYWLGNGHTRSGFLSGHLADELEVREQLTRCGYMPGIPVDAGTAQKFEFTVLRLVTVLREIGVLGNKHVPDKYLWANEGQRRALLAGLLDSDGYCDPVSGHIEFCSTTRALAEAVVQLGRSLGEKPVLATGRAKLNGKDYGEKYRVTWRPTVNPFRLTRKAAAFRPLGPQGIRNRHRMITSVEPIPPVPMRCITVDSPNSMYLVGEGMIPTHNTRMGSEWIREMDTHWESMHRDNSHMRFALLARTAADVRDVMLEGPSGLLNIYPPSERDRIAWTPSRRRIELPNGSVGILFSAEEPDQLRGPQFHIGWCLAEGTLVRTAGGELPIEAIEVGDKVWTRKGLKPVLRAGLMGVKPVMALTLEDGTVLRSTAEHHIFTRRGWVQARDVVLTDTLYAWTNPSPALLPSMNGQESSGTGTQRMGTTETQVEEYSSTLLCGSSTTGESPKDTTSTTLTTTGATTASPTSRQSVPATTESITHGIGSRTSLLGLPRSSLQQPVNGLIECGPTENHIPSLVSGAAPFSRQSGCEPGSAPHVALRPLAVVHVETYSGCVRTYDLTVADQSEYFANGVLVHNSDETASYKQVRSIEGDATAWQNLRIATRLGTHPQILATTTPKRVPMLKQLLEEAKDSNGKIIIRRGRTLDNVKLSQGYLDTLLGLYGGTHLGRQELEGEMLDDVVGAMTSEAILDQYRVTGVPIGIPWIKVVGVDPSVAEKPHDECGIVVVYISNTWPILRRHAFVVEDLSLRASPTVWGDIVVKAAHEHGAIVVAETNQGASLVKQMVRQSAAAANLQNPSIREVWSSKSKAVRSEPVGGAYARGRVHHVNMLPELEDQLMSWVPGESGYSPDRMDALVHACAAGLFPEALIHGSPGSATLVNASRRQIPMTRQTAMPGRTGGYR